MNHKETISIRRARLHEIEWINQRYDEVNFVHSNFDHEIIALAEVGNKKVGLSRLVTIDSQNLELGGMYVFPAFRNHGIASELVKFLLKHVQMKQTVYCIPFAHLTPFYSKYGFHTIECHAQVPEAIRKKALFCKETYPEETKLMILRDREDLQQLWCEEYQRKGIPSSYREEPTSTLEGFVSFLQKNNIKPKQALDLGCGRGRNAFYLASQGMSVTCFDLVETNIQGVNKKAHQEKLPVKGLCLDITTLWPIENNAFDIAIDVFCYKHITNKADQLKYRQQLSLSLKSQGYYFLNLASDKDGYYGPLLHCSPDQSKKLIIDPHSNIPSLLYDVDEVIQEFSEHFKVIHAERISSKSPMYGVEYKREVLSFIFKKMC